MAENRYSNSKVGRMAAKIAVVGVLAAIPVAAGTGIANAVDPGPGIGVPGPGVFVPRTGSADRGAPGLGLLPGLGWGLPGLPGHPFLH